MALSRGALIIIYPRNSIEREIAAQCYGFDYAGPSCDVTIGRKSAANANKLGSTSLTTDLEKTEPGCTINGPEISDDPNLL